MCKKLNNSQNHMVNIKKFYLMRIYKCSSEKKYSNTVPFGSGSIYRNVAVFISEERRRI